ncbi:TIGR02678 family protein [Herbidospora sp. NBRC 101105]|uniref:TIGR02678 family protein n=1 Tax=Herbidospora sp. NBRC 101105 TaxID=3032195 RepID=UPI0024A01A26|nr:TIGR02678 family protein [Herbidospora sp. NBRC 101105]GLX97654.1 hypothetical protein Hesp01_56040 [Herbidospora sp. NBRC 101105]
MTTSHHSAADRRTAARALLAHPMITLDRHPEEFSLIRRHAVALKSAFATSLGYTLVVESRFARLVKAPLTPEAPVRPAVRASGLAFDPPAYALLALVCASLLAPDTGDQILVSQLIEQVRADAVTAGIPLGDTLPERRNLVAAIAYLIGTGVVTETDGTVTAWGERKDEALLTINRAMLPHLLSRPLHPLTAPEQMWENPPDADQPRRSLRRRLVENPMVHRADLSDAERDVLSRERTELARVLDETFGLTLEVRAEGALAYDDEGSLTDVAFPGNGKTKQAALLLIGALTTESAGPWNPAGRSVEWSHIDGVLTDLAAAHPRALGDLTTDLPRSRKTIAALLESVGLATVSSTDLVVHPAAARYRPEVLPSDGLTRARKRLEPEPLFPVDEGAAE